MRTSLSNSSCPSFPIMKGNIVENSGRQEMERKQGPLTLNPLMLQMMSSHASVPYSCLSVRLPLPLPRLSKLSAFFRTQPTLRSHTILLPSLLGWWNASPWQSSPWSLQCFDEVLWLGCSALQIFCCSQHRVGERSKEPAFTSYFQVKLCLSATLTQKP